MKGGAAKTARIVTDILMALSLPFLMAYSLVGERFHEALGTAAGCLFVAHHVLNLRWHKSLFRGKYGALRKMTLAVDALLTADVLLLTASGVVLSRFVFRAVRADALYAAARLAHLCAAYWGFLLMSFHAGTHIPVKKISARLNRAAKTALTALLISVCGFGIFSFVKNNFFDCLFLRTHFVFLDFERPRAFFFAEYVSVMILSAALGAAARAALSRRS